jgi:hypothetical protein
MFHFFVYDIMSLFLTGRSVAMFTAYVLIEGESKILVPRLLGAVGTSKILLAPLSALGFQPSSKELNVDKPTTTVHVFKTPEAAALFALNKSTLFEFSSPLQPRLFECSSPLEGVLIAEVIVNGEYLHAQRTVTVKWSTEGRAGILRSMLESSCAESNRGLALLIDPSSKFQTTHSSRLTLDSAAKVYITNAFHWSYPAGLHQIIPRPTEAAPKHSSMLRFSSSVGGHGIAFEPVPNPRDVPTRLGR